MNRKHIVYSANHCGGLKECIDSECPMDGELAYLLITNGIYEFYGYDERIHAERYILKHHERNVGFPTWIHIYDNK